MLIILIMIKLLFSRVPLKMIYIELLIRSVVWNVVEMVIKVVVMNRVRLELNRMHILGHNVIYR